MLARIRDANPKTYSLCEAGHHIRQALIFLLKSHIRQFFISRCRIALIPACKIKFEKAFHMYICK